MNTSKAAGKAIREFTRNLSRITHPCVRVAAMVVSEIKDKLSPKKAPPTTTAVMKTTLTSVFAAIPAATGTSATMVPTDVPMEREMKHDAKKIPASSRLPGSNRKVRFTVASIAPMA